MSPWRWSRSSVRPRSQAAEGLSGAPLNRPPSYATLPQASLPDLADNASLRSVTSGMSQLTTPSYATHDRANRSMAASTATLTNPPRYSGMFTGHSGVIGGSSGEASDQLEYSYPIRSGFKSEPWANLRLYDAEWTSTASRTSKRGKHPRFTDKNVLLGHVELSLSSSQVIKNMELVLKGSIVTGSIGEGSTMAFIDHSYLLWDRKFGDPRSLPRDYLQPSSGNVYDGKLFGNWIFPFAIPFPSRVNLATLRAVYEDEGPVRFLPELVSKGQADGQTTRQQRSAREVSMAGGSSEITPFDIKHEPNSRLEQPPTHCVVSAGAPVGSGDITPFDTSQGLHSPEQASPHFVAIVTTEPAVTSPSVEPYTLQQSSASSSSNAPSRKRNPPTAIPSAQPTPSHLRHRGATPMQKQEPLVLETTHALPQSFLEGEIVANIQYELVLNITHGRFSTKSRVDTTVIYEPSTIPPPMTLARQVSYRRREIPTGPSTTLDQLHSWKQLPAVSIMGTYLDRREVTVQYQLSLAMPLSYARGTVLPCCLTVACDEADALDLLASPRTPRVRLRRFTRFLRNQATTIRHEYIFPTMYQAARQAGDVAGKIKLSDTPLGLAQRRKLGRPPSGRLSVVPGAIAEIQPFTPELDEEDEGNIIRAADEDYEQDVGKGAVWCTPRSFRQEPHKRTLYGEIRIPRGLQPTCKFPLFNILYCVELLAPASNAFVPSLIRNLSSGKGKSHGSEPGQSGNHRGRGERVYASHFVEITTDIRRDEPVPISFIKGTDPA